MTTHDSSTTQPPKIEHKPTHDLMIHPQIKALPEWGPDHPRFNALVEDIRDRGIDVPILVDDEYRILDGRHRWRAAKRLKLATVPILVRDSQEVARIAVNSLLQRRHYTKGQLAYISYPLFAPAHQELREAHVAWLKSGGKGAHPTPPKTAEDLAEEIGINRNHFAQAARLHEYFERDDEVKEEWEPKILDEVDPVSIGAAIAGIKGQDKTKDKPKQAVASKLNLFRDAFRAVNTRIGYWDQFDDETKEDALSAIRQTAAAMPIEVRKAMMRAFKEANAREAEEKAAAGESQS